MKRLRPRAITYLRLRAISQQRRKTNERRRPFSVDQIRSSFSSLIDCETSGSGRIDVAPSPNALCSSGSHYVSVSLSLPLENDVIALVLVAAQILLNAKHLLRPTNDVGGCLRFKRLPKKGSFTPLQVVDILRLASLMSKGLFLSFSSLKRDVLYTGVNAPLGAFATVR